MVEEPIEETNDNTTSTEDKSFKDTYDYFPDFGI